MEKILKNFLIFKTMVNVITFDLYGTLVDWRRSIGGYLDLFHPNLSNEFFKKEYERIKDLKDFQPYSNIIVSIAKEIFLEKNIPYQEEYGKGLVISFSKSPFFPDSIFALQKIKKYGFRTGIISNTEKNLIKNTICGLEDLFDFIVTAEDTGFYKPNEMAFKKAYEIMGVDLKNVIHVSAYPEYDLITANKLNIKTVCVDRYGCSWDVKINMVDLPEFVKRFLSP